MENAKLTKRQLQGLETRVRIYETARELFKEKGYGKVTINDITSRVGVTRENFYTHFQSKAELFLEYTHHMSNEFLKILNELEKETFESPIDKYFAFIRSTLYWYKSNEIYIQYTDPSIIKILASKEFETQVGNSGSINQLFIRVINQVIASGYFNNDLDALYINEVIMRYIQGELFVWHISSNDYDLEDKVVEGIKTIIKGLR